MLKLSSFQFISGSFYCLNITFFPEPWLHHENKNIILQPFNPWASALALKKCLSFKKKKKKCAAEKKQEIDSLLAADIYFSRHSSRDSPLGSSNIKRKMKIFRCISKHLHEKVKRKKTTCLSTLRIPSLTALHDAHPTPLALSCRQWLAVSAGAPRSVWLGRGGAAGPLADTGNKTPAITWQQRREGNRTPLNHRLTAHAAIHLSVSHSSCWLPRQSLGMQSTF